MDPLRKYFFLLLVIPLVVVLLIMFTNRTTFSRMDWVQNKEFCKKSIFIGKDAEPAQFCSSKTDAFWLEGFGDENNTAWPWNLTDTWDCPNFYYNQYSLFRRKSTLDCTSGSPKLVTTMTNSPSDIQIVEPGNACLRSFIKNCCHDTRKGNLVPNVVHYVWYSDVDVGFFTMASFVSVLRFMRPCVILLHGPYVPRGTFWNFFISIYPNVILVNETLITHVFGQKLKFKEHGSDVMRIQNLRDYGGLYLDWDEVLIKPIDPLRKYSFTMSVEKAKHLGNQFILAEQNATFLTHWYMGYKNYTGVWDYNSIVYPHSLSKRYPELIHVEMYTGLKPKQLDGHHLWYDNSDWSNNYALHLYLRGFKERAKLNMKTIRRENTTIGAVCRRILLGKKEMCLSLL